MAQSSILKDKEGDVLQIDKFTGALATENQWQALLEEGLLFTASHVATGINNSSDLAVLIKVGATPIHLGFRVEGTGETEIRVRETVLVSGDGTAVPVFNRNRVAANTPSVTVFVTPTITDEGTVLLDEILAQSGARETRDGFEFILAANTNYSIVLDNISGGSEDLAIVLDWFEDTSLV